MKKFFIAIVVFCSAFLFCTKESPTATAGSEYTDSMVIDLYSYFMWCLQHNNTYYGTLAISPKGQALVQAPLNPNTKEYNSGPFTYPILVPKYAPSKFEAFAYDSLPLILTDSTDPEILVKSYSNSMHYMFRLDSAKASDTVQNVEKGIHQIDVIYLYGVGFYLPDYTKWGLGKIKIYYK
jgi:hypothetical protein